MRKLTIIRHKNFVGCLIKMKVYIEDPLYGDLTINTVPCRKLGEIKNGQQMTVSIGDDAARVFVIVDKLSKEFCNDCYQLPAGQEDVILSGKNKYNPATGNAFRFDNNDDAFASSNRKRGLNIGVAVLLVAFIVGLALGFLTNLDVFLPADPEEKRFSSDGMSITLTDEFRKASVEAFTVVYESQEVAVFALREPFTLAEGFGEYTLQEYGELVIQGNQLTGSKLKTKDGLTSFTYTAANSDTTYYYFSYVYKADDAFWMVQFAVSEEKAADYSALTPQWAASVSFSE